METGLSPDFGLKSDRIDCLDHGFVRLVKVGGDDQMICDAARLSYANAKRQMISDDAKLIDYLMEHGHTSPFEQVVFWFHCKMPIFVARQWVRHRTARLNEFSGRYSEMRDEFYVPDPSELKIQSTTNRQGRGDETVDEADAIASGIRSHNAESMVKYQELLKEGTSKEIARIVLPLSTYTEWYWQMDLHNLFHFLKLRMDSHAQYEIRVYAEAIAQLVRPEVPMAWESFERHVLNAAKFSEDELEFLRKMISYVPAGMLWDTATQMRSKPEFKASNDRKVSAFFEKLGMPAPK